MLTALMMAGVAILVAVLAYVGWSWRRFSSGIGADVAALAADARPSDSTITSERLEALPEPVQRYLRHAGVVGQKIPRLVHLRQTGRIRSAPGARWMTFEAEQVYSLDPPAFVWRPWLPSRRLPVAVGRDEYLRGEGSIVMKALGTLPVAAADGPRLAEAGLMRYLNEMMWFPAAYLGTNVTWTPIDAQSAGIAITDRGLSAAATLHFDAVGRLTNFSAPRFNTATGRENLWETPIEAYGTLAGTRIPTAGKGVWRLPEGDFAYIELTVLDVRYD